jgi:glycosyltransferase involved in cell wall biosynthesis
VGEDAVKAGAVAGPVEPHPAGASRVAVVGVSVRANCGVHDHATLLAAGLAAAGVPTTMHWLERRQTSLLAARAEFSGWTRELSGALDARPPHAVLMHYSVFSYSYRGMPLFVHPALAAVRHSRIPLLAMMHELAYPWRYSGWRGDLWALSQRALLIEVMRACRAAIVTADARVEWLASRPWLPARRVLVAPVFSNLPPPSAIRTPPRRPNRVVGLFGYSYEGAALSLVLDAIGLLESRGVELQLRLLGAPGRASLPAQELSDELAGCDVLLFPDAAGPSSRKGSLAGALASGTPVVALVGPNAWAKLIDAEAACVVAPTPAALAQAVGGLLADDRRREALGARGRAFADTEMGLARSVEAVTELLGEASRSQPAS